MWFRDVFLGFLNKYWLYFLGGSVIFLLARQYYKHSLQRIPGPFLAKFTNLWRMLKVAQGGWHNTSIALHAKYGPYVRIGPNVVTIADPEMIREIYGFGSKNLLKTEFYDVFKQPDIVDKQSPPNLFATRNEKTHAEMRKPVANAYSMTALIEYEGLVDETIRHFMGIIGERFANKETSTNPVCDIASWVQYYAFDVIGQITWGKPFGFLDSASDINGSMEKLAKLNMFGGMLGQLPMLYKILVAILLNPVFQYFFPATAEPPFFHGMAAKILQDRFKQQAEGKSKILDADDSESRPHVTDFLTKFLVAHQKDPVLVHPETVIGYLLNNIMAGSDTTAITLRAIIYYVLKTPGVLSKLRFELDGAQLNLPVSWADSRELPYLDAVIKEALRFHPAVGLPLERTVSPDGLFLNNGQTLPSGTIVSMNAWVIHRNKTVFGADADLFNPSRWLRDVDNGETAEAYQERITIMKRADLAFGAGSRTCIGKNISMLEIYKVIPTMFLLFDFIFVDPDKNWTLFYGWFVRQAEMDVFIESRGAFM